jgi:isopentenyl diphosphate isomerase/L-lactate dehydrogenase-like FMN-dependent dehydrogenase
MNEPMLPVNLAEYETLAARRLPRAVWDYYAGGADDELTVRDNRAAYARRKLRPRVLVDVSRLDLGTTVLGIPVAAPVLIAPLAFQKMAHPHGEAGTARAAAAAGTLMIVSTLSTTRLEEVAAAAPGAPRWFQLYVYKERAVAAELARRAGDAGYRALVLTVDTPRLGRRERDLRNGFTLPHGLSMANFEGALAEGPDATPGASGFGTYAAANLDTALTWNAIAWLRSMSSLPVVVKGILTAEDARLAVAHGAAAIVVSNHGGRQLDGTPATLDVLAEVVDAVGGTCEVYVDGGIRRGTDVVKALALGARAVLLGRPVLWGLAHAGDAGVARVLSLLFGEIEHALALCGRPGVHALGRDLVQPSS